MAKVRNKNPTRYCLTIGDRGAMRLPAQETGRTYHHMIPFHELRAYWNTSVACNLEELRETFVPVLQDVMPDYPLDQEHPDRAARLIAAADRLLRMIRTGNYVHDATAMSPFGIDDFNAIYTWMPGNLFAGPTNRGDTDPGGQFDTFASRFVEESRYLTVKSAHQAIQTYLGQHPENGFTADATGTRAKARAAQLARAAGLALGRVAAYTDATAYDPDGW